jgi:hypothetical protein
MNIYISTKKAIIRVFDRLAAFFASDVRRIEQKFRDAEAAFDVRLTNLAGQVDVRLDTLEKDFEKEAAALSARIAALEAELHQTFVEHLKYHTSAERQLAEKIETDASSCFEAAAVRLTKVIEGQAATAEFSRVDAELSAHTEALRHLDATKRDGAGLRGYSKPAMLN